jgi:hypothetical protein
MSTLTVWVLLLVFNDGTQSQVDTHANSASCQKELRTALDLQNADKTAPLVRFVCKEVAVSR